MIYCDNSYIIYLVRMKVTKMEYQVAETTVILPSYNPCGKLPEVAAGLADAGFTDIIIIDDGSRPGSLQYFEQAAALPQCTVIHHETNHGKGRALKTGFEYFLKNRPQQAGVVTADDDGQHAPGDIARCAAQMQDSRKAVFGARDFSLPDVPPKSRFGNKMTSFVFRALCGIRISDTQTGLRAFPRNYLELLCSAAGERFEYETNALLEMHRAGLEFTEIPIRTIYINNNGETHFSPFRDSMKIYAVIMRFLLSSCFASLIDIAAFTAINLCLPPDMEDKHRVFAATFGARVISSLANYFINRTRVFRSKDKVGGTLARYYLLCAVQTAVSFAGVFLLSALFSAQQSFWQTVIKAVVDTLLFFVSFRIQQNWVFGGRNRK